MRTFIACISAAALLFHTSCVSAAEVLPRAQISFAFGMEADGSPPSFSAGFTQPALSVSEQLTGYMPLINVSRTRSGELSVGLGGKSLNATEGRSGPNWLWWTLGAIATVVVVAVVASGLSGNDEEVVDGGVGTSACGNNDGVLGNECVAVPRPM